MTTNDKISLNRKLVMTEVSDCKAHHMTTEVVSTTPPLPSLSEFIKDNEPSVLRHFTQDDWSEPKYRCPECGGNVRKELNVIYTSNPPCYRYQCENCKYTTWHHY